MTDLGRPRRAPGLEVYEGPEAEVVLDDATGQVHQLNPSAALIFELCDGTRDVGQLVEAVTRVWSLDEPPTAAVEAAVAELVELGLLVWDPATPTD